MCFDTLRYFAMVGFVNVAGKAGLPATLPALASPPLLPASAFVAAGSSSPSLGPPVT